MTIEEAIYARLAAFTALTDLVGDRISPLIKLEDAVLPAITYRRVFDTRFPAMGVDSPVVKARFQLDIYGASMASVAAVRDQLDAALSRYRADSPVKIFDCFRLSEVDLYEEGVEQHHIAIDYEINYSTAS